MTAPQQITVPAGTVTVTTYGSITAETMSAWGEMREANIRAGINCHYNFVQGTLVDRARNQAVVQMLANPSLGWMLFVDGDAVFPKDALIQLLTFAYSDAPYADAVGAYCTLRGEPYLPTIDTGTAMWESHLPGQGAMEVIRTGSALILLKRHCFERIEGPWYGTRNPMRPIDALAEVDNFAHTRFDGRNPLADYPEWQALLQCAKDDPGSRRPPDPSTFVGEDSNWCDRMRFHGLRIFVQTDVVCEHLDRAVRGAKDHRACIERGESQFRQMVGATR